MSQSAPTDERGLLLAYLNVQREHILGILDGLSEEELHRPLLPSGWSCIALINHLALDVERFWFRAVVAGERSVMDALATQEDAWQISTDVPASDVFAMYRQEIAKADAIIAATPLDAPPTWWPDFFGDWRMDNLRDLMLHVITETACHAGHLDVVRELIDGRKWMVLTE